MPQSNRGDGHEATLEALANMDEVIETDHVDLQLDEDGDETQMNDYRLKQTLGRGAYAETKLAEKNGEKFAVKIINKSVLKRQREVTIQEGKRVIHTALEKVHDEVAVMKKLQHPNVVQLFEVLDDPQQDKMYMVLEYEELGQIMDYNIPKHVFVAKHGKRVKRNGTTVFTEKQACQYCREIIVGLHYVHFQGICHRDLKPENILLSKAGHCKIGDFGVSHFFSGDGSNHSMSNTEGTYHYLAPECLQGGAFDTYDADVWALGVILFNFLCGTLPFWSDGGVEGIMDAIQHNEPAYPSHISVEVQDLLKQLLHKERGGRLCDLQGVLNHPWMVKQGGSAVQLRQHDQISVTHEDVQNAITNVLSFATLTSVKVKMHAKAEHARIKVQKRHRQQTGQQTSQQSSGEGVDTAADVQEGKAESTVQVKESGSNGPFDNCFSCICQ